MNWRIAFFVSAAINILVIGAALGFVLGGGLNKPEAAHEAAFAAHPRAVLAALPGDARQQVRRELARAWIDTREHRAALRAAREQTARAMASEPYDAEAVGAALARQRRASEAVVAKLHEHLAAGLARLTPEQRRAVLEALTRRGRGAAALDEEAMDAEEEASPLLERPAREDLQERRGELREKLRARLQERRQQRLEN